MVRGQFPGGQFSSETIVLEPFESQPFFLQSERTDRLDPSLPLFVLVLFLRTLLPSPLHADGEQGRMFHRKQQNKNILRLKTFRK